MTWILVTLAGACVMLAAQVVRQHLQLRQLLHEPVPVLDPEVSAEYETAGGFVKFELAAGQRARVKLSPVGGPLTLLTMASTVAAKWAVFSGDDCIISYITNGFDKPSWVWEPRLGYRPLDDASVEVTNLSHRHDISFYVTAE